MYVRTEVLSITGGENVCFGDPPNRLCPQTAGATGQRHCSSLHGGPQNTVPRGGLY